MTTEPDPRIVRKVARAAMEMVVTRRDDLDSAIRRRGGLGDMPEDPEAKAEYRKAYGALYSAAAADMKAGATVTVSWPDEQLDERNAALARVRAFCNRWVEIQPAGYDVIDGFPGVDIKLTISDLLAALGNDDADA